VVSMGTKSSLILILGVGLLASCGRQKLEVLPMSNLAQGEAFLAGNAKKEGVQTTGTGLQYKVIEPGTGASPKSTDRVKVHYHGTLIDGRVFDSSVDRGEPITFGLDQVIPGWTEGLQLMKVGGKSRLFIPARLAYGERSAGALIEANSTLVFEVELLDIE